MNPLEQRIYLQSTKFAIRSFENFVDSLVKHDDIVSDAELIHMMQRISKKLQTVMNKWDVKLTKLTHTDKNINCSSCVVPSAEGTGCIDNVVCFKKIRGSSASSVSEIEPTPGCSYKTGATNYDEEKSIMMEFKNIDEELIIGADGFYVEETTKGFWKCNACDANNLPINNLISHVNGKAHRKKINFKSV